MATLSGQPLPQSSASSPVAELCSCLGLFAVGLAINSALVQCANAQFWLTGEEASVAFKDVVFLRLRLQHCRYDTNLGGTSSTFWLTRFTPIRASGTDERRRPSSWLWPVH